MLLSLVLLASPVSGELVALPASTRLHPTAAAASLERPRIESSDVEVSEVLSVLDAGVREVRKSEGVLDCSGRFVRHAEAPAFRVDAFVAVEQLVPRLAKSVVVEHADGTGAWAARGAPLRVTGGGVRLADPILDAVLGPRASAELAWSVPAEDGGWTQSLSPLACDPGPEPLAAWRPRMHARLASEQKLANDRIEDQAYQACLKKSGAGKCDPLLASGLFQPAPGLYAFGDPLLIEPKCVLDVPRDDSTVARINGASWKPLGQLDSVADVTASTREGFGLARVMRACGEVRAEVPLSRVSDGSRGAIGTIGTREPPKLRRLRAGALVTWPDGTIAGKVAVGGPVRPEALLAASGSASR